MTRNEYMRQRYHARKAAGLCVRCGAKVETPNQTFCDKHIEAEKKRLAEFRAEKKGKWTKYEMTCPDFCPFDECKLPAHVAAKTIGIIDHGERIREPGRAVIFGTIPRNVHF